MFRQTLITSAAVVAMLLQGCNRTPSDNNAVDATPPTPPSDAAAAPDAPSTTPPPSDTRAAAPPKATPAPPSPPVAKPVETVAPPEPMPTSERITAAGITKTAFLAKDPGLQKHFDKAYGYAIFPSIVKGALIVGGAGGDGVVFEHGRPIGYSTMSQGTIGLSVGGQEYSELIFFETQSDLADFTGGSAKFSAQASAVAAAAGGSATAKYRNGVLIFTMAKGGLMLEASVGGQGFSFERLP